MVIPCLVLGWVSKASGLGSILAAAAVCCAASIAVFLPFLVLCLASPLYRHRLQTLVGAPSG